MYNVFLVKDEELIEKYNKIWNKVNNSMKKGFDNKLVYNEKCLKTENSWQKIQHKSSQ